MIAEGGFVHVVFALIKRNAIDRAWQQQVAFQNMDVSI